MPNRWLKTAVIAAAGGILVAACGFAYLRYAPRRTPQGQPSLAVLQEGNVKEFEDAFDAATHRTRIVALLSPT